MGLSAAPKLHDGAPVITAKRNESSILLFGNDKRIRRICSFGAHISAVHMRHSMKLFSDA